MLSQWMRYQAVRDRPGATPDLVSEREQCADLRLRSYSVC